MTIPPDASGWPVQKLIVRLRTALAEADDYAALLLERARTEAGNDNAVLLKITDVSGRTDTIDAIDPDQQPFVAVHEIKYQSAMTDVLYIVPRGSDGSIRHGIIEPATEQDGPTFIRKWHPGWPQYPGVGGV